MQPRDPSSYPRRILLCVSGMTPQIVTETLYALAVRNGSAFVPTELHLVTTTEGAERAHLSLLDPEQGHFFGLCADYGLDAGAIRFDDSTIHVIPGADSRPLDDIRTETDNVAAADAITAMVRDLTSDPQAAVHASIAGGRKTMGFFLGYAMSLFGRPQDRLSHVLVSAPFESHPQFYFPPRKPRRLELPKENRYVHTADAEVTLADIPFVRLRDSLDPTLLRGTASYSDTVKRAQASLEPAELVLDLETKRVLAGGAALELPPTEFALLALLARRAQDSRPGLSRQQAGDADATEFLAIYRDLPRAIIGTEEKIRDGGLNSLDLEQWVSRLNAKLDQVLGPGRAQPYRINTVGPLARSCYALLLKPEQIRFGAVED
ncbi:MAG TPA: CRISPR-associated ring nuclease Csm6 [Candidatus Competibacteraceae bacterium]|nr:CRISPR-associated ring nuclease Csm6 [Candidatus Competibacteraceae bacterium]